MRTGQSFTVTFHVSKVGGTTAGYQSEVLFDPTRVVPTSIIQGPYLKFKTFFGSPTAFKGMIRIGALNFPIPTTLPKGAGSGVLATARKVRISGTFTSVARCLGPQPIKVVLAKGKPEAPGKPTKTLKTIPFPKKKGTFSFVVCIPYRDYIYIYNPNPSSPLSNCQVGIKITKIEDLGDC